MSHLLKFYYIIFLMISISFSQNPFGQSLKLNGQLQYFEIPDTNYINLGSDKNMTIEMMIKTGLEKSYTLLNKWDYIYPENYDGTGLLIDFNKSTSKYDGKFEIRYRNPMEGFEEPGENYIKAYGSGSCTVSSSGIRPELSVWNHVAFVITDNSFLTTYLNGKKGPDSSFPENFNTPTTPLCLGGFTNELDSILDSTNYFIGNIDEVRIWNKVRSTEELIATMNDTLGPGYYKSDTSGLVAYYRFDQFEDLSSTGEESENIRDLTSNENHGLVLNGAILEIHENPSLISAEGSKSIYTDYKLHQNFPNPFNPTTTIRFFIPKAGPSKLAIYDVRGREVQVLMKRYIERGYHEYQWNSGELASGIYFVQLRSEKFSKSIKMLLNK